MILFSWSARSNNGAQRSFFTDNKLWGRGGYGDNDDDGGGMMVRVMMIVMIMIRNDVCGDGGWG